MYTMPQEIFDLIVSEFKYRPELFARLSGVIIEKEIDDLSGVDKIQRIKYYLQSFINVYESDTVQNVNKILVSILYDCQKKDAIIGMLDYYSRT